MSNAHYLLRFVVIIVVANGAVMWIYATFPDAVLKAAFEKMWMLPFVHALLLVLLATPTVYYAIIRPYHLANIRIKKQLEEKNDRFEEAQRVGKIGAWSLDLPDGKLIWADEVYRIFGLATDALEESADAFWNSIHPDDQQMVRNTYQNSLVTKEPYEIEHRIVMADGQVKWVEERCDTWYDAEGNPTHSLGTVQDVTERKTADLARKQFLSLISHELRTPLTSIMGSLSLLADDDVFDMPQAARDMARIADRNGKNMLNLIGDILDAEKSDSGDLEYRMEHVDLAELVWNARELYADYGREHGVTFVAPKPHRSIMVNVMKIAFCK